MTNVYFCNSCNISDHKMLIKHHLHPCHHGITSMRHLQEPLGTHAVVPHLVFSAIKTLAENIITWLLGHGALSKIQLAEVGD